MILWI